MSTNDLAIVLQGISTLTLLKIAYSIGRALQKIDSRLDDHERRITRLEDLK